MLMHWRQLGVKAHQHCLPILLKNVGETLHALDCALQVAKVHKVDALKKKKGAKNK